MITDDGQTASMFKDALHEQLKLYSSLYSNKETSDTLNNNLLYIFFPTDNDIPILNEDEKEYCEGIILEEECVKVIKTFKNGKSPGTDKIFWNNIKDLILESFSYSYENKNMSISQKQNIITLLPKKR